MLTVELVAELLAKTGGNMSAVGRKCGVSRTAVSQFVARHPELAEVISDIHLSMADYSVAAIVKGVRRGTKWAVERVLDSSLGKSTGLQIAAAQKEEPPKLVGLEDADIAAGLMDLMNAATMGPEKLAPPKAIEGPKEEPGGWKIFEETA